MPISRADWKNFLKGQTFSPLFWRSSKKLNGGAHNFIDFLRRMFLHAGPSFFPSHACLVYKGIKAAELFKLCWQSAKSASSCNFIFRQLSGSGESKCLILLWACHVKFNLLSFASRQGDQMSLWKNRPKSSPKYFLSKLITTLYWGGKVAQNCGLRLQFSTHKIKNNK
jgi:hypothetical protein